MRTFSMLATAAVFIALAGVEANAGNPNVPSWSPYAIMDVGASSPAAKPRAMVEHRAAYVNPNGAPVDYKSVGLSGNREDCNSGCAAGSTE